MTSAKKLLKSYTSLSSNSISLIFDLLNLDYDHMVPISITVICKTKFMPNFSLNYNRDETHSYSNFLCLHSYIRSGKIIYYNVFDIGEEDFYQIEPKDGLGKSKLFTIILENKNDLKHVKIKIDWKCWNKNTDRDNFMIERRNHSRIVC